MLRSKYLYLLILSIAFIFLSGVFNLGVLKIPIIFLVFFLIVKFPYLSICYFLSFYYIHPGGLGIPFPFQLILILGVLSLLVKATFYNFYSKCFVVNRWLLLVLINFVLLSFYASFSLAWSIYEKEFVNGLPLLINVSFSAFLMFFLLNSIKDVEIYKFILMFWVIVASLTFVNGFIHSVIFPDSYIRDVIAIPDFSAVDKFEGVFRWLPPQRDPNYIATTLIIPAALSFSILLGSSRFKLLFFLVFLSCLISILMSFSRTSYVVISLFILFYSIYQGVYKSPFFLISVFLSVLVLFQIDVFVDRLDSLVENAMSGSGSGRSTFFAQAISLWSDNILIGVGYWQFNNYFYYAVHNTFLEVLVGLGLVGLALFVLPILFFIVYYFSLRKKHVRCKYVDGMFFGFVFYCLNLNSVSLVSLFEYVSFLFLGLFFLKESYKYKVGLKVHE